MNAVKKYMMLDQSYFPYANHVGKKLSKFATKYMNKSRDVVYGELQITKCCEKI